MGAWVFSGILLLFLYNNCGRFMDRDFESAGAASLGAEDYPWPNESTTIEGSSEMVSKVLFGDFDRNSFEDAIFVSASTDDSQVMIRVVRSGSFTEQFNIMNLPAPPDGETMMLLEDLDGVRGDRELIYLSADRTRVIGVDLMGNPGSVRFDQRIVEPISLTEVVDFRIIPKAVGSSIEIGNNTLIYGVGQAPQLVSGLQPVDGGWGPFDPWHQFSNGTRCSKVCGDGIEVRNRVCNNPAPQNGGAFCPLEVVGAESGVGSVHHRACRLRDCLISECAANEVFNNGSCDPDPNATNPYAGVGGSGSVGGTSGTGSTGSSGPQQPSDCTTNQVWDPYFHRCYRAYPHNNIFLTYRERQIDNDDNGGFTYVNRTYRLSVNHSRARAMTAKSIAGEYCRHRGHADVVSYVLGTYVAGSGGDRNVFVLCNYAINGMYHRGYYSQCPVGNYKVSFAYNGILHNSGSTVQYLKSVICRKND